MFANELEFHSGSNNQYLNIKLENTADYKVEKLYTYLYLDCNRNFDNALYKNSFISKTHKRKASRRELRRKI